MANTQQGDPMLEKFFSAPKTLMRLRGGISGPHIDAFADDLERDGYAPASAVRYIRAAAHLGCFLQRKGDVLSDIDLNILDSFGRHLRRCRCPHFKRGKISYHAHFGVKLFHRHLVRCGICPRESVQICPSIQLLDPTSATGFEPIVAQRNRLFGSTPAVPQIYSGSSERMSANGMHRPFETFFWNEPASVGSRRRSHSSLRSARFCGFLISVESAATTSP